MLKMSHNCIPAQKKTLIGQIIFAIFKMDLVLII